MRIGSRKLRWLGALLLAAVGCRSPHDLKPPKHPDEFTLPPQQDKRFSGPAVYPDEKKYDPIKLRQQEEEALQQQMQSGKSGMTPGFTH
jgi:hypothetical protein